MTEVSKGVLPIRSIFTRGQIGAFSSTSSLACLPLVVSSFPQDLALDPIDYIDYFDNDHHFFLSGFLFCYDDLLSKQMSGPVKSSRTKNLRLGFTQNISNNPHYSKTRHPLDKDP